MCDLVQFFNQKGWAQPLELGHASMSRHHWKGLTQQLARHLFSETTPAPSASLQTSVFSLKISSCCTTLISSFDRVISMRLTDQENAIDIVSLISTKLLMKSFIIYKMVGSRRQKLSGFMVTHSCILAWRIPWTEKPGRLQSVGSQRVRPDWVTSLFRFLFYK